MSELEKLVKEVERVFGIECTNAHPELFVAVIEAEGRHRAAKEIKYGLETLARHLEQVCAWMPRT